MQVDFKKTVKLWLAAGLVGGLSACTALQRINRVDRHADVEKSRLEGYLSTMRGSAGAPGELPSAVHIHNRGYWVSPIAEPMPAVPETVSCNLTLNSADPISLEEFAQRIRQICGVRVEISPDALGLQPASANTSVMGRGYSQGGANNNVVDVHWKGPVSGLMDTVTARLGLGWRMRDGAIQIYKYDTQTFQIYALPSTDTISTGLNGTSTSSLGGSGNNSGGGVGGSSSGSGNGSGGSTTGSAGSTQSLTTSLTATVVDDIQKTLQGMLSRQGHMTLSKSTGSVTVTDLPQVLDRVKNYIDYENKQLTKQVLLNVTILRIQFNRSDQYGIDWKLLYNHGSVSGSPLFSSPALDPSAGTPFTGGITILKGVFANSNLLINALSSQGKVSVVTQPSILTMNMQPAPVQIGVQTGFVAQSSIQNSGTLGGGLATSVSLTPGSVTSGLSMMLLPYVMDDNQVLLQFDLGLTNLQKLQTYNSEGVLEPSASASNDDNNVPGFIQLPIIDSSSFSQKVALSSGQTLVISGYGQLRSESDRNGVGSPNNQLLGGTRTGLTAHDEIVILVQPVVRDSA